jgi:hypothetical protein
MIPKKTYYLFVSFLFSIASMRAGQYQKTEEVPLGELVEDSSVVAVVEFVYELNGFELVELLEPRPKSSAHKRDILRNHFVEYEGQWIGAVSSRVNYRKDLSSDTAPRLMLNVPYLVFLRRTKNPNIFNRSVLGDGLIIPTSACSYQFAQGKYGAVPIVDLSPSSLSSDFRNAIEAMNKGQGWRTYSGDEYLDRFVRPSMMSTYGVYDGRLVYEAYKALFALIGSPSKSKRASTYSENVDNSVFLKLLGEIISNVEVNVEVGSNALKDSALSYNVSHSVINILEPGIIISGKLRKDLNSIRIKELKMEQRLSVVLNRIEQITSESGGSSASKVEFHLDPDFDPLVSPNYFNLKLGDLLYFFGVQQYLNFEKNGDKIKVKRL